jgi:hypothetical protein
MYSVQYRGPKIQKKVRILVPHGIGEHIGLYLPVKASKFAESPGKGQFPQMIGAV